MNLRDELLKWAKEQERKGCEDGHDSHGMAREHYGMCNMLERLWPVIEAAERMKQMYEKVERMNFLKDQQDAWAARADMFEALERLKERVNL